MVSLMFERRVSAQLHLSPAAPLPRSLLALHKVLCDLCGSTRSHANQVLSGVFCNPCNHLTKVIKYCLSCHYLYTDQQGESRTFFFQCPVLRQTFL